MHTGLVMSPRIVAICLLTVGALGASCSSASPDAVSGVPQSAALNSTSSTIAPSGSTPIGNAEFTYSGEVAAPDVPNGLDWFNVERPLSLVTDLRGKIVVLDFWTQGCINCLHVIPDLHRLEEEFPDSLAVVGVHWAKFDHERTS